MAGSPSIVPDQIDRDIYLVLDDLGGEVRAGLARNREADTERPALIRDLLDI
ncbi:hypothetical protein ES703_118828 [subsurface metagenome]